MSRRYNSNEQYMFGSAAPKINTEAHEILADDNRKELSKHYQKRKRIEKSKSIVTYKLKLIGNVFLIFVGCLFLMGQYASITFNQNEIESKKSELKEIQNANALLKSEIAQSIDLEAIKEKAINKLGMVEPAPHQIIYIDIPQKSYTAYNQPVNKIKPETNEEVVAASFFDFLNWKK